MMTLLKIVLVLLAIVGLIVLVAIIWFLLRIRKNVRDMLNTEAIKTPYRIHLIPETDPAFEHPVQTREKIRQFKESGFEELGTFSVPEQPGVLVVAFSKPAIAAYGTITCFQKLLPVSDIVCRLADDTEITITESMMGEALEQPPFAKTIRIPEATVQDLLTRFQSASDFAERVPVSLEVAEFSRSFCEAWRRYQQWRLSKGGASREEYLRIAVQSGQDINDADLDAAYEMSRQQYITEVQSACLEQYAEEQAIPPNVWAASGDTWLVVFDTLTLDETINLIEEVCCPDEEQLQHIKNLRDEALRTPTEFVEHLLRSDQADLRLQMIAKVDHPVQAMLYNVLDHSDQ